MNESSKKYWTDDPELVEKYLLGGFSDEERARMDREISDCAPCKEKLLREKVIIAGIRSYGRESAKSALRSKLLQRQSSQLQKYSIVGLAAAVIVIALGVGVYKEWFGEMSFPKNFVRKEIIVHQAQAENDSGSAVRTPVGTHGNGANNPSDAGSKDKGDDTPVSNNAPESDESLAAQPSGSSGISKNDDRKGETAAVNKSPVASIKPFSQKVWLIGSIVMLSKAAEVDRPSDQQLSIRKDLSQMPSQKRNSTGPKMFTINKKAGIQNIVIEQRPLYELPVSRRTQLAASSHIETFVEHNERGLFMTLYNDNIRQSDINHASVVLTAGDSLIVTMDDQQLVYRLPQKWNVQERPLRR